MDTIPETVKDKHINNMNFIHTDLGCGNIGKVVKITLTSGANVRLMNDCNFSSYRNGRRHQYIGGLAKRSPINLQIPDSGRWHVVVDMQGLKGSTQASVQLLS